MADTGAVAESADDITVITGASGFVGEALCRALAGTGAIRAVSRRPNRVLDILGLEARLPASTADVREWTRLLSGARAVVHLAARVHQRGEAQNDEVLEAYRANNTELTLTIARAAVEAGVERFVFTSTSQVHGETSHGVVLREDSEIRPATPYARTKAVAEKELARIAAADGLRVTVLRPSVVYGPGARGNFRRLRRLAEARVPLPLPVVAGKRSFLYLGNLLHLIRAALNWGAPSGTYLVADAEPVTVVDVVAMMRDAIQRRPGILTVSPYLLRCIAQLVGRRGDVDKLTSPFEVSIDRLRNERGWTPPFSTAEGIRRTMLAESR